MTTGSSDSPARPETILFVGAGATQQLSMPTTAAQAAILWNLCDQSLSGKAIEEAADHSHCFDGFGDDVADLFRVVDPGQQGGDAIDLHEALWTRAFPGVTQEQVRRIVSRLRRHYDYSALRLIARAKKGSGGGKYDPKDRPDYLQEVFTLMDVCLRDGRGFSVFEDDLEIFLSVDRIRAARETLVMLIDLMFACAWKKLSTSADGQARLKPYRAFFRSLAEMMQDEARQFEGTGIAAHHPEFYQFSYSLLTTNFEPLFLWFIWKGHDEANHGSAVHVGNPGRLLKLMMNFPNVLGYRRPKDDDEDFDVHASFPCTDAAAQMANNETKHTDDRMFRIGKYYAVHGMSNARQCPRCGRLNLYLGDSWDENSCTLFPNGLTRPFVWGQEPRSEDERMAHKEGAYDALSCQFCGERTYSYDNFMFMQTQLKCLPPSFIKETTDEALAGIAGAKHIVLLGYSMPLDDAIWGSLLTAMSRRKGGERLYCSVAATYDSDGPRGWLWGDTLKEYLRKHDELVEDKEKVRAIKNAIAVFGFENVRAWVQGIPAVFGDGDKKAIQELVYPFDQPGWHIPGFTHEGVVRKV